MDTVARWRLTTVAAHADPESAETVDNRAFLDPLEKELTLELQRTVRCGGQVKKHIEANYWTGIRLSNPPSHQLIRRIGVTGAPELERPYVDPIQVLEGMPSGKLIHGRLDPEYGSLFPGTPIGTGQKWSIPAVEATRLLSPCMGPNIQYDRLVGFAWDAEHEAGLAEDDVNNIDITPCWEGLYPVIIESALNQGELSGGGSAQLLRITETTDGPIGIIPIEIAFTCKARLSRAAFADFNGTGETPLAPFIGIAMVDCEVSIAFSGMATMEWEFATGGVRRIECAVAVDVIDQKTIELTPLRYPFLVVQRSHLSGSVCSVTSRAQGSE